MRKTAPVKTAKKTGRRDDGVRFGPAQRMLLARKLMATPRGATIDDIRARCECSRHTAMRAVKALEAMGEPVEEVRDGVRLRFRIADAKADKIAKLSTAHLLSIAVAQEALGFLEGTGLKEAFDEVVEILVASLAPKASADLNRLRKSVLVVPDAPWIAVDRTDLVDSLATGLSRGERVTLRRPGADGAEKTFDFEPYSLLFWRQGIYVAGYSHHHNAVRTFGLDKLEDGEWKRGDTFEVPASWDARARFDGSFGLFDGPETTVCVDFTEQVARYVKRRRWMRGQRIEEHADKRVTVTLTARGTVEVVNWVLGFGEHAVVRAPGSLRDEVAAVTKRMAAAYAVS